MSVATILRESRERLAAKTKEHTLLFDKKGEDGKFAWTPDDWSAHERLQLEENDLHDEVKKYEGLDEAERKSRGLLDDLARPRGAAPLGAAAREAPEAKSVGEEIVDSAIFREWKDRNWNGSVRFEMPRFGMQPQLKTTMTTSAGYAPFVTRGSDIVPYPLRRPMVQDLMPSFQITEKGVEYVEETTNTQNAAAVAEAASKPESARVFTVRNVNAEVVATTLPVTEQQLADAPFIMGYINASLGQEIDLAEEVELLTGSGSSPHLQGYLTKTGVQTQAVSGDPVETAVYKAFTLVRFTGFAEPSACVFHPNDWQDVVTHQDLQNRYIWGDPATGLPSRIWGVPVVVTPAETENTILIGDFRAYSYVVRRQSLRIDVGWINDQFLKNTKTIRAETRLALVIRRPQAFCKVTGA
jgi:HK97 family phage major capsid protein